MILFGLSLTTVLIMLVGTGVLVAWIVVYIAGMKYNAMFDVLNEKDFPLKETYGSGYVVMQLFRYQYKKKNDIKLKQQLELLYEKKYSDYYVRVIYAQRLSIAMMVFVLSFALYGFANDIIVLIMGFAFSGLAYYYFGTTTKKKLLKRSNEMLHDFSEMVSQLALLTNAGMILREAWEEVAYAGQTALYKEMKLAVEQMKNGVSDIDAIYAFGNRCMLPEIKKFTSTILQGMTKGTKELVQMLQQQSAEVWQFKKQLVRREGEKASSKLLIPIFIMFMGVLIMIIVPIFANLGV